MNVFFHIWEFRGSRRGIREVVEICQGLSDGDELTIGGQSFDFQRIEQCSPTECIVRAYSYATVPIAVLMSLQQAHSVEVDAICWDLSNGWLVLRISEKCVEIGNYVPQAPEEDRPYLFLLNRKIRLLFDDDDIVAWGDSVLFANRAEVSELIDNLSNGESVPLVGEWEWHERVALFGALTFWLDHAAHSVNWAKEGF